MSNLSIIDLGIIILYLLLMVYVGYYFSKKNNSAEQFTKAVGSIPGWAIGVSLYATFLSSNTFLGVPGKAYGTNWNYFVFSLSMPLAGFVAAKYFVPLYRQMGGISAYSHLEQRFGSWARIYVVVCFLLMQLARMGSIFFGIALSLQALTGFDMQSIMIVTGICIIFYTVLGGIEAVIWTEVVQAIIKTLGGLIIIAIILMNTKGGFMGIIETGVAHDKFSLGSFTPDFTTSTFWVVLVYGFFMNLKAFGFDQNYVQRYHTATSEKEAQKSIWLCVKLYVPASLLFFFIGTCLYVFYQGHPDMLAEIKQQVAVEKLGAGASADDVKALTSTLKDQDIGDKVMPHFMVNMLPVGILGIVISAILSAAMSTISSGMNASATVFSEDIYLRYVNPNLRKEKKLKLLYIGTAVSGFLAMVAGIAMIGVKSILDLWWQLSGIFAGGMFGLFLLSVISKKTQGSEAKVGVVTGVLVILWMTFSYLIPDEFAFIRNSLHANMITVVGTLVIFLVGYILTLFRNGYRTRNN